MLKNATPRPHALCTLATVLALAGGAGCVAGDPADWDPEAAGEGGEDEGGGKADAPDDPAPPATTEENVLAGIDYGLAVVGTPYGWWFEGPLPAGAPMYTEGGPPPAPEEVRARSVNCSGLTNLMLRTVGKELPHHPGILTGGTLAYQHYYAEVAEPFDVARSYPAGTLIARRYRDTFDQGHVAVVLDDGHVLQSFAWTRGGSDPGVNTTYTVAESHDGGYYEYAVLPEHWLTGTD